VGDTVGGGSSGAAEPRSPGCSTWRRWPGSGTTHGCGRSTSGCGRQGNRRKWGDGLHAHAADAGQCLGADWTALGLRTGHLDHAAGLTRNTVALSRSERLDADEFDRRWDERGREMLARQPREFRFTPARSGSTRLSTPIHQMRIKAPVRSCQPVGC